MPSLTVLTAFVGACIFLGLTPGPNMSLIVANTISGGLRAGLVTLAGAGTGLAILVTVAALGMTSVMTLMADWFDVVRWVGAIYLMVLGARQFWRYWRLRGGVAIAAPPIKARASYFHGLAVSLSNPKVLLFLGAFLPQFVDPARPPGPQLLVLAILFIVTLVIVDLIYTLAVARARSGISMERLNVLDGAAGVLLMLGGLVLATARRP